ncbi:uncharacterized protein M421DRAFT_95476 [Didymella exigua CBS 183.55]|uniref:Uncharacterized protein n=1 Tax=Didymella exigua CBS 183.55 TaxID=1150837 RepID=A0A6A5R852_9PLEO|nr:uncharacterized protein M421DRAFT_95476 [Didymella exigua CBS 183.55]KAF1924381.1 hypothetical protein M421DRAFT_95476 [Didymella exigua CBS 183.55]
MPAALAPAKLGNFRDDGNQDSDASDTDQSDASGRSLSPTRQGLSKTKKRKERRQFGAFADELGDLLGAAFQNKNEQQPTGLPSSAHAANTTADGDLDMQVEPVATEPKMSRRARQNMERAQARRLAKEKSKMVVSELQTVAAERRGMTIQQYRGLKPEGVKKSRSDATKKRRSRQAREKLKKKVEQASAMEID